jgi:transposase
VEVSKHHDIEGGVIMKITTIGIDLAKDVFQVHGVDEHGNVKIRRQLKRKEMMGFFTQQEPCLVGMEACSGSHFWARRLTSLGHKVKLMAPQFVKPYVKGNKHDVADAEAICEAVTRPTMRFVPIKTIDQQSILAVHRVRQGMIKARTAQANQIRGLLAEFGLVVPAGISHLYLEVPAMLEEAKDDIPGVFRDLIHRLLAYMKELTRQVDELEIQIHQWHRVSEASRNLEKIPGIGPITASALVASIGDARNFKNSRQLAAWLGLVPRQHSSGGKTKLQGISKRGDSYLRTLLIHGARAVVKSAERKPDQHVWLTKLIGRSHINIAAVALANKNARIVWALLAHEQKFRSDYARS